MKQTQMASGQDGWIYSGYEKRAGKVNVLGSDLGFQFPLIDGGH